MSPPTANGSGPDDRLHNPIPSTSIHQSADRMLQLIEAEIHAHTAAAEQEITEFRAVLDAARRREAALQAALTSAHEELQLTNQNIERLLDALGSVGVSCQRSGEVVGYSTEWVYLFEALNADDESPSPEDEEEGKEMRALESKSTEIAEPLRDLARARLLLERRQTKCKRWKHKFFAMQRDRDEQKKTISTQMDGLRHFISLS
ncbi:hypothetical protein B0H19DRAFT_1070518 [Mycena capillaripes]|nr:hypothetical protein B0H19DRAFT_1070518 [Mycena capillaripes]